MMGDEIFYLLSILLLNSRILYIRDYILDCNNNSNCNCNCNNKCILHHFPKK